MKKTVDAYQLILTAKHYQKFLKVSRRTAYQAMAYSDFSLIKIGKCKRAECEGCLAWLEQKKVNRG